VCACVRFPVGQDDDFVAPHPDEEHLDVPSTETTKLHQECEDPDESGSECSDDEDSEASAYEVGGSDEEADNDPDCDGGPDPANLEPPATAQQSASLPEFFDIGSMDDSAPEADEPSEPKAEAAESAEAAAAEAKAAEAAAAQAAAELEEAAAAEARQKRGRVQTSSVDVNLNAPFVVLFTSVGVGSLVCAFRAGFAQAEPGRPRDVPDRSPGGMDT